MLFPFAEYIQGRPILFIADIKLWEIFPCQGAWIGEKWIGLNNDDFNAVWISSIVLASTRSDLIWVTWSELNILQLQRSFYNVSLYFKIWYRVVTYSFLIPKSFSSSWGNCIMTVSAQFNYQKMIFWWSKMIFSHEMIKFSHNFVVSLIRPCNSAWIYKCGYSACQLAEEHTYFLAI